MFLPLLLYTVLMKLKQEGYGHPLLFGVLAVVLIFAISFGFLYRTASITDTKTTSDAKTFAKNINIFIQGNAYIPYDLHVVYPFSTASGNPQPIPSTVSYTKINYTSYRVCIAYKTGTGATDTTPDTSKLVIPNTHGRGQNCQVVRPYVDPIQISGSLKVCDQMVSKGNADNVENSGYISTIVADVTGNHELTLDKVANGVAGPFDITKNDKIYDASCNAIPVSKLHVGQPIYAFDADTGHHLLLQEKLTWH